MSTLPPLSSILSYCHLQSTQLAPLQSRRQNGLPRITVPSPLPALTQKRTVADVSEYSEYSPVSPQKRIMRQCGNCHTSDTSIFHRGPNNEMLCANCSWTPGHMFYSSAKPSTLFSIAQQHDEQATAPARQSPNPAEFEKSQKVPVAKTAKTAKKQVFRKTVHCDGREVQVNKNGELMICNHCKATKTPMWRRDAEGMPICNACGLYMRIHKKLRPLEFKKHEGIPSPEQKSPSTASESFMMLVDAASQL